LLSVDLVVGPDVATLRREIGGDFSFKFSVLSRAGQPLGHSEDGGHPHRARGKEPTGFGVGRFDPVQLLVLIPDQGTLRSRPRQLWVDEVTNCGSSGVPYCGGERSDAEQVGRDRPEPIGGGGIERPFFDAVRVLREVGVVRHGVGLL
jgi:hypothetical protein